MKLEVTVSPDDNTASFAIEAGSQKTIAELMTMIKPLIPIKMTSYSPPITVKEAPSPQLEAKPLPKLTESKKGKHGFPADWEDTTFDLMAKTEPFRLADVCKAKQGPLRKAYIKWLTKTFNVDLTLKDPSRLSGMTNPYIVMPWYKDNGKKVYVNEPRPVAPFHPMPVSTGPIKSVDESSAASLQAAGTSE